MLRNIGRLRAVGSGFSPSQIAFTSGLWLDPSDISTGFQDSAGTTPITASGQQVGKRLDKSGKANHVLQSTSSARPENDLISGIWSDFFDAVDDGYSTATFVAGTLVAAMDCFIAIKRGGTAQNVVCSQAPADVGKYFGVIKSGTTGSGSAVSNVGAAWTAFVNGTQVGGTATTSADDLNTALGSGSYKVLEFHDLNLSAWTQFTVGAYTSFLLNSDIAGLILCPSQSTTNRTNLRKWIGAKAGLSL